MKITRPRLAILIIAVFGSTTVFTQKSSAPVCRPRFRPVCAPSA